MSVLVRRVQVLLSDSQYSELANHARLRKKSVGAVIREAIAAHIGDAEREERIDAARRISEMRLPVSDWEQMERESTGYADPTDPLIP